MAKKISRRIWTNHLNDTWPHPVDLETGGHSEMSNFWINQQGTPGTVWHCRFLTVQFRGHITDSPHETDIIIRTPACFSVCPLCALPCWKSTSFDIKQVKCDMGKVRLVRESERACIWAGMRGRERKDGSVRMRPFQKIPLHRVGRVFSVQNVTSHWYNEP